MFTPKPQLGLRNAKEYFRKHLSVGNYYSEGQQVAGEWFGLAAEQLGLKGKVGEADFLYLCEGLHPATGQRLTQRKKFLVREEGKSVANRRVFYDFTISPPKSVSVVALYQDDRILALHNRAVKVSMGKLEKFAETRVGKSSKNEDRVTGNFVAASPTRYQSRTRPVPSDTLHCV